LWSFLTFAFNLKSPRQRLKSSAHVSRDGFKVMNGQCFPQTHVYQMVISLPCRIYYQNNPKRLPVCTLPIHTLLHLADCIEAWGPVWCYWSFPMERFCGFLKPGVSSMRHPYASMDHYLLDWVTMWHLGTIYNIKDMLQLKGPKKQLATCSVQGCKCNASASDSID
jgi:hypothetical protein